MRGDLNDIVTQAISPVTDENFVLLSRRLGSSDIAGTLINSAPYYIFYRSLSVLFRTASKYIL